MADWHPDAIRVPFPSAGSYVAAGKKLLWHTTETRGLPSYAGTQPHFTLNPRTGQLWQHQSIAEAAKALAHPAGTVETNRAQVIQVELVCYSDEKVAANVGGLAVPDLTNDDYARIAKLARWIERNAGVPRKSSVVFKHYPESSGASNGVRLSSAAWLAYEGHLGHQHVPGNLHGDPSSLLIAKVLAARPPWKIVKDGEVLKRGTFGEVRQWLKGHARKVKRLGGVNIRPNRS